MENLNHNNREDIAELQTKYGFLDKRINELETLIKTKLEYHDKAIADIESERKLQNFQYGQIMESLKELNKSIVEIKSTPTKRWDIFVTAFITGIVTLGIGFLANIMK